MTNSRRIFFFGAILIVILAGFFIWHSLTFHLVKTDPPDGSKTNQYTAVSFMFNKPIAIQGNASNKISLSPRASGKTTISQKSVTFVPDSSYQTGTTYTATLNQVTSASGKTLRNLKVVFTPQYVSYNNLPKDIQERLVSQTDTNDSKTPPYSASVIAIQGTNSLVEHGLTSLQIADLQKAIYNFGKSKKEQIRGVVLSDIVKQPRNPYSSTEIDTITFVAALDNGKAYTSKIEYPDLKSLRLFFYNQANGSLVYDSGRISL